jgi:Ca2+-binding RTX toxin-like protein
VPPDWVAAGPVPVAPASYDHATAASFVLPAGSIVLHLFTINPAATTAIDLTGNGLPQTIEGNAGNNVIDGKGGIDAMYGYGGDDAYFVDHPRDAVYEAGNAGFDTVYSAVSFVLTGSQSIEKLAALSASGTDAINLTGNELAQAIYANAGDNILDGKAGADSLYGYAGNDTYYVDDAGDLVFEVANSGFDTVLTNTTYQLGAGQSIERLATTSPTSTGGVKLTGNEFGQQIAGNAGANVINGKAGNDTLTGGAGADTFVFDTALSATTNVDTITDFVVVDDTIRLENDVFTAVGKSGALNAAAFRIGPAAGDADDRIVYDSATGNLYYDADGTGAAAAVIFAKTSAGLAMTASDFTIV